MVRGWRRAFCTSIPKEDDTKIFSDKHHRHHHQHQQRERPQIPEQLNFHGGGTGAGSCGGSNNSPRISSKFGFFSNPSTPRPQSQPVSSPSLRCRTTATSASSVPSSPRLHCKTAPAAPKKSSSNSSSRLFSLSNPSSPRSPSSFSLLKASLRLSRTRCGICIQSVKTGQGTAIFTAECSHTFHFPCIAAHVKKHQILVCPVCSTSWKEIPLLDAHTNTIDETESKTNAKAKSLRVYDDDESLLSPSSISGFNPIPESDESNEDQQMVEEEVEFQGFCVSSSASSMNKSPREEKNVRSVDVSLLPESAVISVHRSYGTCAVILKVKAPPQTLAMTKSSPRAPVDLVTVLDVGASMNGDKLHMMKRAMRSLICLLGEMDRLSIVAFSATSKRLLPFKRMTMAGRRSARRIVDAIGCTGQAAVVNDALKKAAKILEDRRERNPVGTIMLMSDGEDQRVHANACKLKRNSPVVSSTRFGNIPVHAIGFCNVAEGAFAHAVHEDAFVRCLGGLLSVVVQELKLQLGFMSGSDPAEITAVYSLMGRPEALGSGLIRVGDLYAEEERDLLVELRVPSFCGGSRHVMSVGSSFRDPITRDLVYSREQPIHVPRPQTVRSQTESLQRLKNLHVTARAIAESRRLMERSDLSGAYHLLSSARALLVQAGSASANEFLRCLEAELAELQRFRQKAQRATAPDRREATGRVEEKAEPLTPTSAWRAAERLAKVAIMRKSMNRVSDLHGFENARF